MKYDYLILDKKDGKATITLNRPQALNALNRELLRELKMALDEAGGDKDIGVIILRGSGRAFCAGVDLKVMEGLLKERAESDLRGFWEDIKEVLRTMEEVSKPVICAVHGYAVTGGFALTYFSDLVVAAEDATFQDTHASWGLVPSVWEAVKLPRVVGIFSAKRIMLAGDRITATEAEQMGLVYKVVPGERLDDEVEELAARILKQSRRSLAHIKSQINRCARVDWPTALEIDSSIRKGLIADCITEDGESRLKSFVEKNSG